MPIPDGSTKIVISGTYDGGEVWATAYWLSGVPESEFDNNDLVADWDTAGPTSALFLAMRNGLFNTDHITAVDAYYYAGGSAATHHVHADYSLAGQGTVSLPLQNCVVMSLRTARPGRSYRGRMYFPLSAGSLAAGHLIAAAVMEGMVDALAGVFTANVAAGWTPSVISTTLGISTPIVSVDADQRADTQRRRANKQAPGERYSASV